MANEPFKVYRGRQEKYNTSPESLGCRISESSSGAIFFATDTQQIWNSSILYSDGARPLKSVEMWCNADNSSSYIAFKSLDGSVFAIDLNSILPMSIVRCADIEYADVSLATTITETKIDSSLEKRLPSSESLL